MTAELLKTDQAKCGVAKNYSIITDRISKAAKMPKRHNSVNQSPRMCRLPKLTQRRNTALMLLSDYRPKEFGNTKIDLTIDGG